MKTQSRGGSRLETPNPPLACTSPDSVVVHFDPELVVMQQQNPDAIPARSAIIFRNSY